MIPPSCWSKSSYQISRCHECFITLQRSISQKTKPLIQQCICFSIAPDVVSMVVEGGFVGLTSSHVTLTSPVLPAGKTRYIYKYICTTTMISIIILANKIVNNRCSNSVSRTHARDRTIF
jgi:hypothetical protein